ncbi:MAG: GyrI-like domain-containing protein [Acidimicrobiia bacterium]
MLLLFDSIGDSYQTLAGWIGEHGYRISGPCVESYLSRPDEPGPPVTEIRMPIVKV